VAASDHLGPQWYHGTPSGDLRGSYYGLHVGTQEAARQALNARIGTPVRGDWDGTRRYGDTMLRGSHGVNMTTGERDTSQDYLPSGEATYSSGDKIDLDSLPEIMPVAIHGPMTNTPDRPHGDWQANGIMAGQVKRGRAKSGYYYRNEAEDEGSVSAVVPPGGAHLKPLDTKPKQLRWDF
jgi:hypothetical protein